MNIIKNVPNDVVQKDVLTIGVVTELLPGLFRTDVLPLLAGAHLDVKLIRGHINDHFFNRCYSGFIYGTLY